MRTFARRNRTLAPPPDAEPLAAADGAIYIGIDWKRVVAAWPEEVRRRHAEIAGCIRSAGWTQPDAAEYLAYERISEGGDAVKRVRCFHCGAAATRWCDFVVAREKAGEAHSKARGRYPVVDIRTSRIFTCDRPLCEGCAHHAGNHFSCGERGGVESIDYCRDHAHGRDEDAPIITKSEAEAIQARLRLKVASEGATP